MFYAWHYYGTPKTVAAAVENAQAVSSHWKMPSFLTEFMDCDAWTATVSFASGGSVAQKPKHSAEMSRPTRASVTVIGIIVLIATRDQTLAGRKCQRKRLELAFSVGVADRSIGVCDVPRYKIFG